MTEPDTPSTLPPAEPGRDSGETPTGSLPSNPEEALATVRTLYATAYETQKSLGLIMKRIGSDGAIPDVDTESDMELRELQSKIHRMINGDLPGLQASITQMQNRLVDLEQGAVRNETVTALERRISRLEMQSRGGPQRAKRQSRRDRGRSPYSDTEYDESRGRRRKRSTDRDRSRSRSRSRSLSTSTDSDRSERSRSRSRSRSYSPHKRTPSGVLTRGPSHDGLKTIRTGSSMHRKVVDYRYYRLIRRTSKRSGRDTQKVKDHLKRLELTMHKSKFDGTDPITILSFLARIVRECDTLDMSEAQAYIALPYFLTGSAHQHFDAAKTVVDRHHGGVSCWPEAIQ